MNSISKTPVYKWYFYVYPCSPFQPPYIPVKWGLPLDPVSNQPTGWLLLFCNNILISSDCCFDEGLLLLLLIYWSTELTPTWVIKYSWKQGNGPPALLVSAFPLSLPFFLTFFVLSLPPCFINVCFYVPFHHASLVSSSSLSPLFFFLISLISYLLLFLKSDRSLVLKRGSDLTPTQAIKSREATVGIWTTSGRMGTQISFHIFYSLLFVFFHTHLYYISSITKLSFYLCNPPLFVLFSVLPSLCLPVSPPPYSLDWLEWVKQANLFFQGLKLPACLFGCGEARMISALPSVTTVHAVQIKSKSVLFVLLFPWRKHENCWGYFLKWYQSCLC